MFGYYKLKMTYKQVQFCILCCTATHLRGVQKRGDTWDMGDLAGDGSAETSFAWCIVWEADLTFMTVELIAVENPDDKCVLAIKKCSKTKENCLSNIICILCVQRSTSLTAEGRQF